MGLKLVTAPAEEPVTSAEAKAHLRVTTADEDTLIASLIIAAREFVENHTHRRLITQTWDWVLDSFSAHCLEVPHAPLQSVSSITYVDTAGATQTLGTSLYTVDAKTDPGRVQPAFGESWPSTREVLNAVTVRFIAGYGLAASVPQAIKQAMLLLIGHWFENREAVVTGTISTGVQMTVDALLAPHRVVRF